MRDTILKSNQTDLYRIIFYHSQSTSARMRFLYFTEQNSVLGFSRLPNLSVLNDQSTDPAPLLSNSVEQEILALINQNIPGADLRIKLLKDCCFSIETANKPIIVCAAGLTDIDPPEDIAKLHGGKFLELPYLRKLHHIELGMLQRVYQYIMG